MAEVKKMTQTAIVRELAETTGVNNKVSKHYLESLAELAVRETKKNGVFIVPGIGRLVRAERKARVGRNPATGEAIKIPAKKVVKFRLAKSVKDCHRSAKSKEVVIGSVSLLVKTPQPSGAGFSFTSEKRPKPANQACPTAKEG